MRVSETNGAQPCQARKENSPTSGLLRFLVAQGGIDQGRGCLILKALVTMTFIIHWRLTIHHFLMLFHHVAMPIRMAKLMIRMTSHLMGVSAFVSKNTWVKHAGNHGDVTKDQE